MGDEKMAKKDMKKANTNAKNCKKNNVTDNCNHNNVTNANKNDIGFQNESHSFELDHDNKKSFELE